jgi:hypothetical protein
MNNIMAYLNWRGDLSFDKDKFGVVDNTILSILAFNDFSGIVPNIGENKSISLGQAGETFFHIKDTSYLEGIFYHREIPKLLEKTIETARFRDICLSQYEDQLEKEVPKQFSAMVFSISPKLHYVAFRGVDSSIVGWKEEVLMGFFGETHAQRESIAYAKIIMKKLGGQFIFGGHSKGGNLAVYAASRLDRVDQDRIIRIYNNDGPGFHPELMKEKGYLNVLNRITTLLPESAIVGMLLENNSEFKIVRVAGNHAISLKQHNPLLWEVKGKDFVYRETMSERSKQIAHTIRAWLKQLSKEDREEFVESLFHVIQETGANTILDLTKEKRAIAESVIRALKHMDKSSKANLKRTVHLLFEEGQKTFRRDLVKDLGRRRLLRGRHIRKK